MNHYIDEISGYALKTQTVDLSVVLATFSTNIYIYIYI